MIIFYNKEVKALYNHPLDRNAKKAFDSFNEEVAKDIGYHEKLHKEKKFNLGIDMYLAGDFQDQVSCKVLESSLRMRT